MPAARPRAVGPGASWRSVSHGPRCGRRRAEQVAWLLRALRSNCVFDVEQLAAYEAAGFEIAGMFPVTRDRETLRLIEVDVMMVRAEARSRW